MARWSSGRKSLMPIAGEERFGRMLRRNGKQQKRTRKRKSTQK
jgi:hypothetical protein